MKQEGVINMEVEHNMATIDTCKVCGESQKRHRGHKPYRVLTSYSYFNPPTDEVVCPRCAEHIKNKDFAFGRTPHTVDMGTVEEHE